MAGWQGEKKKEMQATGMEAKIDKGASICKFNKLGPSTG